MSEAGAMADGRGQRRGQPISRSHEDIYDAVSEASRKADDAVHRTDLMAQTLQRVESKVDDVMKILGHGGEDEQGRPIGTGLVGTVMRLSKHVGDRFRLYDRWMALAIGGIAVGLPMAVAIWWLIQERVAEVLK